MYEPDEDMPTTILVEYPRNWWNTATLIPGSTRHNDSWGFKISLTSAQYALPGWVYRPRVTRLRDGQLVAAGRVLAAQDKTETETEQASA